MTTLNENNPQTPETDITHIDVHSGIEPQQLSQSLLAATEALIREQNPDGHWCAELEGDSILQSEYILMKWILGEEDDPNLPRVANHLRSQQRSRDGAWIQFPGAKPDLSATVKAYFALKLCGDDTEAPHMRRARELVLRLGGMEVSDTYTKFYLAQLGQLHFDNVPAVPPELFYLPKWCFFHLDKISSWSRGMVIALMLLSAGRKVRPLPPEQGCAELLANPDYATEHIIRWKTSGMSWANTFLIVDKGVKLWQKTGFLPGRKAALDRALRWIERRTVPGESDGLGAIFPPMVYYIIALKNVLHRPEDDPHLVEARQQLDRFMLHDLDHDSIRFQPCLSPVWDSGYATYALADAGLDASHPAAKKAADWLVAQECTVVGDWANNLPSDTPPGGWYFEYNNAYYPDVDDTAMVAMALQRIGGEDALAAAKRGVNWALAMQNSDGGWAAFDKTEDIPLLEKIPFADHNAIQDPSCSDITGRTLDALSHFGYDVSHPAVKRAVAYMKKTQEPEGCWWGRWGVNYIYGTWQAVGGMRKIGVDMDQPWIQRAGQWLKSVQQDDGSFGETANSYEDRSLMGQGPPTASQTAWGTMALMSIYGHNEPGVQRGVQWLMDTQLDNGDWHETEMTGTGFPKIFYLRYHLYRLYFPVMCLGRYKAMVESASDESDQSSA
ncbi:MAG: squalene--hopene cyclase [Planctomycetota bacterium]|jgi:squalene-hopene/tetraprenyl-beta-curcumene cyclase